MLRNSDHFPPTETTRAVTDPTCLSSEISTTWQAAEWARDITGEQSVSRDAPHVEAITDSNLAASPYYPSIYAALLPLDTTSTFGNHPPRKVIENYLALLGGPEIEVEEENEKKTMPEEAMTPAGKPAVPEATSSEGNVDTANQEGPSTEESSVPNSVELTEASKEPISDPLEDNPTSVPDGTSEAEVPSELEDDPLRDGTNSTDENSLQEIPSEGNSDERIETPEILPGGLPNATITKQGERFQYFKWPEWDEEVYDYNQSIFKKIVGGIAYVYRSLHEKRTPELTALCGPNTIKFLAEWSCDWNENPEKILQIINNSRTNLAAYHGGAIHMIGKLREQIGEELVEEQFDKCVNDLERSLHTKFVAQMAQQKEVAELEKFFMEQQKEGAEEEARRSENEEKEKGESTDTKDDQTAEYDGVKDEAVVKSGRRNRCRSLKAKAEKKEKQKARKAEKKATAKFNEKEGGTDGTNDSKAKT
ncbi:hypothetical protein CC80DRAFT_563761 [Byssothecium circinans]|uniref:Uncharacterized protein n=1 Tax=Byssothecium circinans TaxID=147558 RepID=A0A6A5TTE8_9PLEO|nr:hypothetical protein CC80DRAFT_563761 [Byssothecium circinans]